jgi:hypothetical protein
LLALLGTKQKTARSCFLSTPFPFETTGNGLSGKRRKKIVRRTMRQRKPDGCRQIWRNPRTDGTMKLYEKTLFFHSGNGRDGNSFWWSGTRATKLDTGTNSGAAERNQAGDERHAQEFHGGTKHERGENRPSRDTS